MRVAGNTACMRGCWWSSAFHWSSARSTAMAVSIHWLLGLVVNVTVLFFALGFRQFSHRGTEIQIALANGDLIAARQRTDGMETADRSDLFSAADLDQDEVVRQAIEHGLLLSQRHVFGVFFWFVVLPGPIGAVVYRLAEHVARIWNRPPVTATPPDQFGDFARRAFAWIDWAPARLTSLGFAVVGDFEGRDLLLAPGLAPTADRRDAGAGFAHADTRRRQWSPQFAADACGGKYALL